MMSNIATKVVLYLNDESEIGSLLGRDAFNGSSNQRTWKASHIWIRQRRFNFTCQQRVNEIVQNY